LEDQLYPPQLIVLRGEPIALKAWQARLNYHYAPRRIALAIPNDATELRGILAHCIPRGEVCAYVCSGTSCSAPIDALDELESHLIGSEVSV